MDHKECMDRVKFTLSDDGGALRFASFDIKEGGCCQQVLKDIRAYLMSRPLEELDMRRLKDMSCPSGGLVCIQSLADAVEEYQRIFCDHRREKEFSHTAV